MVIPVITVLVLLVAVVGGDHEDLQGEGEGARPQPRTACLVITVITVLVQVVAVAAAEGDREGLQGEGEGERPQPRTWTQPTWTIAIADVAGELFLFCISYYFISL